MEVQIKGAPEQQAPQQRGGVSALEKIVGILMGVAFIVAVVLIILLNMGWVTPAQPAAAPVPTVTQEPRATSAPVATRAPAVQQQAQPTTAPAVIQADPAAPAPTSVEQAAPVEYQAPGAAIPQPTPDAWYQETIRNRPQDACSMPHANPATCGQEVPPLPWPNGRP